jgi:hypothetical protein
MFQGRKINTTLPGYFEKPDNSQFKRKFCPVVIIFIQFSPNKSKLQLKKLQNNMCLCNKCYCQNKYSKTPLLCSCDLCFPSFATFFQVFIMYCLPWVYISKISNLQQFTSLACLQREQFWHKMVSAERTSMIYIFTALTEGTVLT